ncbi:MAG: hypothetical protein Kow0079_16020 [Vicingaceae bacterium]
MIYNAKYYPFGMLSKSYENGYRYGFNGKENDNEVLGLGRWQDYGERQYRPDLGRFFSPDPLIVYGIKYAWYSPYQFAGDKPVWAIDFDGLEEYVYQYLYSNGNVTLINIVNNSELKPLFGGWGAAAYQVIDKRTGKVFDKNELGTVQFQYFDADGNRLNIRKNILGEYVKGNNEIMKLNHENWLNSIYIGPDNPEYGRFFKKPDYRREPKDLLDKAAMIHDQDYDKLQASGIKGALFQINTVFADIKLIAAAQKIIDNYGNNDFIDPYTGKPISDETYQHAILVKAAFSAIANNKLKAYTQEKKVKTKKKASKS